MCKFSSMLVREELTGEYGATINQSAQQPDRVVELLRVVGLDLMPMEQFWVVHLNTKMQCIGIEMVSSGNINNALVSPRDVFRSSILANSAAIIVAHNHPSGDPSPSDTDDRITKKLIKAGELMGIPVIDHLIVGDDTYYSYKEEGRIN